MLRIKLYGTSGTNVELDVKPYISLMSNFVCREFETVSNPCVQYHVPVYFWLSYTSRARIVHVRCCFDFDKFKGDSRWSFRW